MNSLEGQIEAAARTPFLLVACDYDGVLAPIVTDPSRAFPASGAVESLRCLLTIPQTAVAVVTGRGLADLRSFLGPLDGAYLAGCHGAEREFAPRPRSRGSPPAILNGVQSEARLIAAQVPGFRVEDKPLGFAFHYREADPLVASAMLGRLEAAARVEAALHMKTGKKVLEFSTTDIDKGEAVKALQGLIGPSKTVFLGDDATDEDAFAALGPGDIGIKIGEGDTRAHFRVDGPSEAVELLQRLARMRAAWLRAVAPTPIERHSVLSDQRTLSLVNPDARVTWLCLPRVDSPAIFAELLGGPGAGYWSVRRQGPDETAVQSYIRDSFVLRTAWSDVAVTDYLDCSAGRPYQRAGRTEFVRLIEGSGRVLIEFAPRLDFGRIKTRMQIRPDGLEIEGTLDPIVLYSPRLTWRLTESDGHHTAIAEASLSEGPALMELRYGVGILRASVSPEPRRREQTTGFWQSWASSLRLPGVADPEVVRSALTIKALTHGPSGAILAAATTSLPETPGGIRNWDYRYCWPRDAALSAAALLRLGNTGHAMRFLDWTLGVLDHVGSPDRMRPIYTVTGRELSPEAEIGELSGYSLSRPVRIHNAASQQVQLDVFGPIVEVAAMLANAGSPLTPEHWRLVEAMVDAVHKRWHEPDHGIWEIRGERRQHVHSKVMCWVAVDRAISLASAYIARPREAWSRLRDAIASDVLRSGWNPARGAFTVAYGSREIDAGALLVGLSGLLPPDDGRFAATVQAVEDELREGPVVFRYRYADGLPGTEGGFHLCTSWLIESYVLLGRRADAENLFRAMLALMGPTGLLSEEYCPRRRLALGNVPQAYSHLAVINSAVALASTR